MGQPGICDPGHRAIEPGFHWLQECVSMGGKAPDVEGIDTSHWDSFEGERHQNQSAFLLEGDESLLFDTLTPASETAVIELLGEVLQGRGLDYVVISHPEGNHAGNAFALLEAFPEATLLVPEHAAGPGSGFGAEHELFHLASGADPTSSRIQYISPGDRVDLGRYEVEFVPARYADHAFSVWMIERTTNTFFPVDWLGFHHQSSDCLRFADEFDREVTERDVRQFHNNVFPWLQFADPAVVASIVDELIEIHDPDRIAPAHGTVIRERPRMYAEYFKSAVRKISREGNPDQMRERFETIFPEAGAEP